MHITFVRSLRREGTRQQKDAARGTREMTKRAKKDPARQCSDKQSLYIQGSNEANEGGREKNEEPEIDKAESTLLLSLSNETPRARERERAAAGAIIIIAGCGATVVPTNQNPLFALSLPRSSHHPPITTFSHPSRSES